MSTIEKVARAMHETANAMNDRMDPPLPPLYLTLDEAPPDYRRMWRSFARAAIAAMRPATPAMIAAAKTIELNGSICQVCSDRLSDDEARQVIVAAIDAALAEGGGE